jgi:hypothetical protein
MLIPRMVSEASRGCYYGCLLGSLSVCEVRREGGYRTLSSVRGRRWLEVIGFLNGRFRAAASITASPENEPSRLVLSGRTLRPDIRFPLRGQGFSPL